MSTTTEGNPDLARKIQREINKASGWYMALGVVLLLGGIAGILYPTYAGLGLTVLVGWLLIISGAMYLFNSLLARSGGGFLLRLLLSALYIVAGVYMLMNPFRGLAALTLFLGAVLMANGVLKLLFARALKGVLGTGMVILSGLLSILLAILIWAKWPASSEVAIGVIVGIDLFFSGLSVIGLALRARGVGQLVGAASSADLG